ncbi:BREX-1 system adenine-specific DNA-methyltransferase PglX, partial [Thermotoga sp.]|uniref:BREX-1 system adenine-specific DNA-methyltransferase PglX n=1 Tax=Thermotoga sp. TaxID=28240 RepID=UPI0025F54FA1
DYMPQVFEKIDDWTELLFPDNLYQPGSMIYKMNEIDQWKDISIIGWLYQFYISEKKDEVMKTIKEQRRSYEKDEIPIVTQLFTPHWIVSYMVENSLGRLWLEAHPDSNLKSKWRYYIDSKLLERPPVKPEEIKFLDPCVGSGHILLKAFDLLYDMYLESGYPESEIPAFILKNNLYGLDIDKRAVQLAYFSLYMKAAQKDKGIFEKDVQPHIYEFKETSALSEDDINELVKGLGIEQSRLSMKLINDFKEAKIYGSLIKPEAADYSFLKRRVEEIEASDMFAQERKERLLGVIKDILEISDILSKKYDVVVTNPPYMGKKQMNKKLKAFLEREYPKGKADTFAAFILRNFDFLKNDGFNAMVTMQSWMFLPTFEEMRKEILRTYTVESFLHLGPHAFEEISGEIVQTCSFVFRKRKIPDRKGIYFRLVSGESEDKKESFLKKENIFVTDSRKFTKIPGWPIAYWVSDEMIRVFDIGTPLGEIAQPKAGLQTSDNNRFLRLWYEVDINRIGFGMKSREEALRSGKKWFPYNKGGKYRKWYGNHEYVVNWENDGEEIRNFVDEDGKLRSRPQNMDYYFREGITWSFVSSSKFGIRYTPHGFIFDVAGSSLFPEKSDIKYILAFLASNLAFEFLKTLNPTLNFQVGNLFDLPIIFPSDSSIRSRVEDLVQENIDLSKKDWDDFEVSWNFRSHPFIRFKRSSRIEDAFMVWKEHANARFEKVKRNEKEINELLIKVYGLEGEISPYLEDNNITVRKADIERDVKSFLSYAIGCIFGRYSPDIEGLVFAGGDFDMERYPSFKPVEDNVLVILDEDYHFENDIVRKVEQFIEYVYGKNDLEENLTFIAKVLSKEKTEDFRQALRKYFRKQFYKDHLSIYKRRPIYWMVSSKKEHFKALFYYHRFNEDTLAIIRTKYLIRYQAMVEKEIEELRRSLKDENILRSKKRDAQKRIKHLEDVLKDLKDFEINLRHFADMRISFNLDDGVEENYKRISDILERRR